MKTSYLVLSSETNKHINFKNYTEVTQVHKSYCSCVMDSSVCTASPGTEGNIRTITPLHPVAFIISVKISRVSLLKDDNIIYLYFSLVLWYMY